MNSVRPLDIALLGVPRLNIDAPPMGIASLKANLEKSGYLAHCVDLNIELYHALRFDEWLEIDNYFQTDLRYTGTSALGAGTRQVDFIHVVEKRVRELKCYQKYNDFLTTRLKEILDKNPKWIGLSIFSVNSIIASINILRLIRDLKPEQKIVVGGMGLSSFGLGGGSNFGDFLKQQGLINCYIAGEGEHEIVKLLEGDSVSRTATQIGNLDELPFPDYSDFNFDLYPGREKMIYITGSRGCVRRCTFCDINALWKKFKFRSGASLAQEIYEGYHKYKTTDFYFTDSLINGNLKEFEVLLDCLIDYKKQKLLPQELIFGGQWICRPRERFGEDKYKKMAEAGVYNISVGVESGSDSVLADMRKGTTRADYDFMMEMLDKYGIRLNLLMLIGYPTETADDFQKTMDLLKDYKKYSDSGTIWGVVLGKTMVILPNTPIAEDAEHWGILYDDNGNWVSKQNQTLTYNERVRRRIEAGKLCEDLGYVIKSQVVTVNSLYEIVKMGGYDSIS